MKRFNTHLILLPQNQDCCNITSQAKSPHYRNGQPLQVKLTQGLQRCSRAGYAAVSDRHITNPQMWSLSHKCICFWNKSIINNFHQMKVIILMHYLIPKAKKPQRNKNGFFVQLDQSLTLKLACTPPPTHPHTNHQKLLDHLQVA